MLDFDPTTARVARDLVAWVAQAPTGAELVTRHRHTRTILSAIEREDGDRSNIRATAAHARVRLEAALRVGAVENDLPDRLAALALNLETAASDAERRRHVAQLVVHHG